MASRDTPVEGGAESVERVERATNPDRPEPPRIGYVGKRLGRFHIVAELGRGGMATVYRARDLELGRDVAVKIMHGFFAGRTEIEARFRREANAVAAIRHPSILAVYDFVAPIGEEPGYIVSELITGPALMALAEGHQGGEGRKGRLMPEILMLLAVRVADALGAAHAAGIVHRDVKPDNVLIDRPPGGTRVVLTDFGVAHVSNLDTMTATGAVLGSPAYMSPEQARGEDVGPASDVFSLGVLMYQLGTGHLPFTGKDPLAVIAAILRGEYLRPGKIEARIGPDLEQVIARCLHRDPAARFPDGAAVAAALRAILAAAAIGDEQAALERYFADSGAAERELAPRIAQQALGAAEQARRRRQLPRAIAEVGRALAYAPDDARARELLERLGSRRGSRALWGLAAVGAAAAIAAAVWIAPRAHREAPGTGASATESRDRIAAAAAPVTAPLPMVAAATLPASGSASSASSPSSPSSRAATAQVAAAPASPAARSAAQSIAARRARATGGGATTGRKAGDLAAPPGPAGEGSPPGGEAAAAPAAAGPPNETSAEPAPERTTEPPPPSSPPAPAPAPAPANVVLRASHGFCEPSLDGNPPSLRASYSNVAPGVHEIFCTLPQGGGQKGGKVRVASYTLLPGTRASLIIVPGPDGRPVLGRPE